MDALLESPQFEVGILTILEHLMAKICVAMWTRPHPFSKNCTLANIEVHSFSQFGAISV